MRFVDFFWLIVIAFVFASVLAVLFGVTADILRDHEMGGWTKAIWILLLLLFPLVTALVYLIVRGSRTARRPQPERSGTHAAREVAGRSPAEEIATAKSLLDAGTITEDEFRTLKDGALGRTAPRHRAPEDSGDGTGEEPHPSADRREPARSGPVSDRALSRSEEPPDVTPSGPRTPA